eukprot:6358930-Pyramimonas_sp.AAC.1
MRCFAPCFGSCGNAISHVFTSIRLTMRDAHVASRPREAALEQATSAFGAATREARSSLRPGSDLGSG